MLGVSTWAINRNFHMGYYPGKINVPVLDIVPSNVSGEEYVTGNTTANVPGHRSVYSLE